MTDSNLQNFHIGQCLKGENEGKVKLEVLFQEKL